MTPERIPLALLPTPLHPLPRLSRELGVDLWIKRDDLTGFAFGGNKARKLEYLLHEAVINRADLVVTCGSAQSNFIRQLAAGCSVLGLGCAAAVMPLPFEFSSPLAPPLLENGGNVLLGQLLGAELEWHSNGSWEELYEAAERLAKSYEAAGRVVYRIPIGGSSALGAFAFTRAGAELDDQLASLRSADFDFIITASSSGSTQTGLTAYFAGSRTKVIGMACDPEPEIAEDFASLSKLLNILEPNYPVLSQSDFWLEFEFVGEGYGVPSLGGLAAIKELAQKEGIFLDPIYSAKAFSGLLNLVRTGKIQGKICFWHTGGLPALFAMP